MRKAGNQRLFATPFSYMCDTRTALFLPSGSGRTYAMGRISAVTPSRTFPSDAMHGLDQFRRQTQTRAASSKLKPPKGNAVRTPNTTERRRSYDSEFRRGS